MMVSRVETRAQTPRHGERGGLPEMLNCRRTCDNDHGAGKANASASILILLSACHGACSNIPGSHGSCCWARVVTEGCLDCAIAWSSMIKAPKLLPREDAGVDG